MSGPPVRALERRRRPDVSCPLSAVGASPGCRVGHISSFSDPLLGRDIDHLASRSAAASKTCSVLSEKRTVRHHVSPTVVCRCNLNKSAWPYLHSFERLLLRRSTLPLACFTKVRRQASYLAPHPFLTQVFAAIQA